MHKLAQTSRPGHKRCLSEFENKDDEIIFEDATRNLPRWLDQNFKESGQMIKVFRNDNQAHLKIFVFQYLEMCYGSTRSRYSQNYMERIYELLQKPEFQFFLSDQPSLKGQTQINMKNLLSQFLNYLHETGYSVESSLHRYPIILDIFVSFMRTLLYLGDICNTFHEYIPMDDIYEFLTAYFQVDNIRENNWIRFVESGIFGYQENVDEVYMVYGTRNSAYLSTDSSMIEGVQKQSGESSEVNILVSQIEIDMNEKMVQSQLNTPPTFSFVGKKHEEEKKYQTPSINSTPKQSISSVKKILMQRPTNVTNTKFQSSQKLKTKYNHEAVKKKAVIDSSEILFRPSIYTNMKKKATNSWINPNITKQFTSSIILQQVNEPYRTNIQKRKCRAREERKVARFMLL